jgi:hypothetical protein
MAEKVLTKRKIKIVPPANHHFCTRYSLKGITVDTDVKMIVRNLLKYA